MKSLKYFLSFLIILISEITNAQSGANLTVSLLLEKKHSDNEIVELLNLNGFNRSNLKKIDLKIYKFDFQPNRSKVDFSGIQVDLITLSYNELCESCSVLTELIRSNSDHRVFLIKKDGYSSDCLSPKDYELLPVEKEFKKMLNHEKKLAKKGKRHLIIWQPEPSISISHFTVSNFRPIQVKEGEEIKINFFLNSQSSYEDLLWTNEKDYSFKANKYYKPGQNSETFTITKDSRLCLNYTLHNLCPEKICTDHITVIPAIINKPYTKELIKIPTIPMIKSYLNNNVKTYIMHEMDDGRYGAEYEVVSPNQLSEYHFIVPKNDGIVRYGLEIKKLHFKGMPNSQDTLILKDDNKLFKDPKYTRLVLTENLLYENVTPPNELSFSTYSETNDAGTSIYHIESEIRIIPIEIKDGYYFEDLDNNSSKNETKAKVTFQFCKK